MMKSQIEKISEKQLSELIDKIMDNWNDWPTNAKMFFKKGFRVAEQIMIDKLNGEITE